MTRQQLINVVLPLVVQDTKDRLTADRIIEMKTTSELGILYARFVREGRIQPPKPAVTDAEADAAQAQGEAELEALRDKHRDRVAQQHAERAADYWEFQHQQEPQGKAEAEQALARDRVAFNQAAKLLRKFTRNDANFNLCCQVLGAGNVSVHLITEGIASGALQLSEITQTELDEYRAEDVQLANQRLRDMNPLELREQLKREPANRIAESQRESAELLEEMRQSHIQGNFPALPSHDQNGKPIDAKYLKKLCNTDLSKYKFLIKKFGGYQLTLRLQGRA